VINTRQVIVCLPSKIVEYRTIETRNAFFVLLEHGKVSLLQSQFSLIGASLCNFSLKLTNEIAQAAEAAVNVIRAALHDDMPCIIERAAACLNVNWIEGSIEDL